MDIGTHVRVLNHDAIEEEYRGATGVVESLEPTHSMNNIVKFDHPEQIGYTTMPFEDTELEIIE